MLGIACWRWPDRQRRSFLLPPFGQGEGWGGVHLSRESPRRASLGTTAERLPGRPLPSMARHYAPAPTLWPTAKGWVGEGFAFCGNAPAEHGSALQLKDCWERPCRAWLGTTGSWGGYLDFSAIQASSFSSSTSSGTEPSFSTSAWNSRMSNLAPSLSCARLRSSWIFSSPVL